MSGRDAHHHDHAGHDHAADDGHAHDHADDGHDHGLLGRHDHAPASFGRAFAIGIGLNLGFTAIEALYGVLSNSMSLLADAGHNLSDVLGLVVAFVAHRLSQRAATRRFTYGLRGSSILAALFNAVFLLVIVGGLSWEAILRLAHPEAVAGTTVMVVATIGIVINGATAWLFASGRKGDINIRGAYLHMAADAIVSAGVVVAGLAILVTGWLWIDPVASLLVNLVIVLGTYGLLRDSTAMALQGVPAGIDTEAVGRLLVETPGVSQVHDLHIWSMSTTETALTAHLLMPAGHPGDAALVDICDRLRSRFAIGHATLQVEISHDPICRLAAGDSFCAVRGAA